MGTKLQEDMNSMILLMPEDLQHRLARIAGSADLTAQECALQALAEYVENYESFERTIAHMDAERDRPVLKVVANG